MKQIRLMCWFYGAFVFLFSFVVIAVTGRLMHLMFAWNVILAFVPFALVSLLEKVGDKKGWVLFVLGLWVFFYPNTFYLLTDFIHLRQEWFYQGVVTSPVYSIGNWLTFFHILFLGILGILLGVVSYLGVEDYFKKKTSSREVILVVRIGISVLTGIAIYIGRFLRFNSWDVLRPFHLIKELVESLSLFSVFFVLMFGFLIFVTLSFFSMVRCISSIE